MAEMRSTLSPLRLTLLIPLLLAGCGEEPAIRVYETSQPAAYVWPVTQAREAVHEAGGTEWAWEVPAGWVDAPEVPEQLNVDTRFSVVADYRFKGTTEALPGRATVSVIRGDAGGVMANVTRWRQQLFLTQVAGIGPGDSLSPPIPTPMGEMTIIELAGQYQGPNTATHLSGAILRIPTADGSRVYQTWFFKLVGDRETVEQHRKSLIRLYLSFRPASEPRIPLPDDLFDPGSAPAPAPVPLPTPVRPPSLLPTPGAEQPSADPAERGGR